MTKRIAPVLILCFIAIASLARCYAEPASNKRYMCRWTDNPPQVDGDLSEWEDQSSIDLDTKENVEMFGWKGANDLSGRCYFMWDYNCLYFAADVVDDSVSQPYTHNDSWKGDSIQLGFDMANNAMEGKYECAK